MVFGLGSKQTAQKADKNSKKNSKSSAQADEAAAILKKMEDKKADGECAFC